MFWSFQGALCAEILIFLTTEGSWHRLFAGAEHKLDENISQSRTFGCQRRLLKSVEALRLHLITRNSSHHYSPNTSIVYYLNNSNICFFNKNVCIVTPNWWSFVQLRIQRTPKKTSWSVLQFIFTTANYWLYQMHITMNTTRGSSNNGIYSKFITLSFCIIQSKRAHMHARYTHPARHLSVYYSLNMDPFRKTIYNQLQTYIPCAHPEWHVIITCGGIYAYPWNNGSEYRESAQQYATRYAK